MKLGSEIPRLNEYNMHVIEYNMHVLARVVGSQYAVS